MFNMTNLNEIVGDLNLFNAFVIIFLIFIFITSILIIVSVWKIFEKANKINCSVLIPFWNLWVWFEVCGIRGFWSLVPVVNIFFLVLSIFKIPSRFNKKTIYSLGILFVPYLFLFFIAFDKNLNYVKPKEKVNKKEKKRKNEEKIEVLELDVLDDEVVEVLVLEDELLNKN